MTCFHSVVSLPMPVHLFHASAALFLFLGILVAGNSIQFNTATNSTHVSTSPNKPRPKAFLNLLADNANVIVGKIHSPSTRYATESVVTIILISTSPSPIKIMNSNLVQKYCVCRPLLSIASTAHIITKMSAAMNRWPKTREKSSWDLLIFL